MISSVIIAKNEEKNISNVLKKLSFCDERIVIDDFSTDKTANIAKKYARVFKKKLSGNFSALRNFGLLKARGDWVLFVDADELMSKSLSREILKAVKNNHFSGFKIKREDIFLGKKLKYGEAGDTWLLRLARKNAGKWTRPVHEVWNVKGEIGTLKNKIIHYSHNNIGGLVNKINFYSEINAEYLFKKGKKVGLGEVFAFPIGKFFYNYFIKSGFRDGFEGFLLSFFMSMHSFLTRVKLYYLNKTK